VFDFIPAGANASGQGPREPPPADQGKGCSPATHRDEWLLLARPEQGDHGTSAPNDKELLTLADYMSFNLPLPPPSSRPSRQGELGEAAAADGATWRSTFAKVAISSRGGTQSVPRSWLGSLTASHIRSS